MAGAVPASVLAVCPRCGTLRLLVNVSQGAINYRCAGCDWPLTASTQAPTGTANAAVTTASVAISTAAGGASFTAGMRVLYDTGSNAEIVTVTATGTATSIPVAGFAKAHGSAATFGQLLLTPSLASIERVPAAAGWGF